MDLATPVFKHRIALGTLAPNSQVTFPISGFIINNVKKWSSETPNMYKLVVSLDNGRVVEAWVHHIGFRKVQLGNSKLLVNGVPVFIRGVNRHEHDPDNGRTLTVDLMLAVFSSFFLASLGPFVNRFVSSPGHQNHEAEQYQCGQDLPLSQ